MPVGNNPKPMNTFHQNAAILVALVNKAVAVMTLDHLGSLSSDCLAWVSSMQLRLFLKTWALSSFLMDICVLIIIWPITHTAARETSQAGSWQRGPAKRGCFLRPF